MPVMDRVKRVWNAFRDAPTAEQLIYSETTSSFGVRPDRPRMKQVNDRSIVSSVLTRIAIDVSDVVYRHVRMDDQDRFAGVIHSRLNMALTYEPNLDQGPRHWRQDHVMTLFDHGTSALVATDWIIDDDTREVTDILAIRVGRVIDFKPQHVKVDVYNEKTAKHEQIWVEKSKTPIIENPLYEVMNRPNGTLQRLIRKLSLLDQVDEAAGAGKLDLIIQLPYAIKSEARRNQAEERHKDIEIQLRDSKHGIAYIDSTEKITQLNRAVDNNLLTQVEYLTKMLYGQLGITEDIMNGTADQKAMINYYNRTIEPIVTATIEAMQRTYIGRTRTRLGERIAFFRDPFKFVPIENLAEIADKFTRNEILTGNEVRGFMGIPPSMDPKADKLQNSNMPQPPTAEAEAPVS